MQQKRYSDGSKPLSLVFPQTSNKNLNVAFFPIFAHRSIQPRLHLELSLADGVSDAEVEAIPPVPLKKRGHINARKTTKASETTRA